MKTILVIVLAATTASAQKPVEPVPARTPVPAAAATAAIAATAARQVATAARLSSSTIEYVTGVNAGPTVIGAPYAAEAVTESVQTLPDGNRIVQRSSTKQFRDREGRERRESGGMVMITDPVAKVSYTLHPDTKTAEKMAAPYAGGITIRAVGTGTYTYFTNSPTPGAQPFNITLPVELAQAERALAAGPIEVLGTRNIEGVPANGTRTVTTIAAGAIGNDRAIDVIDERWVSADLQLTVLTRHADPRSGETTYKLTNIQRADQDRALFEIPADYQLNTPATPFVAPKAIKVK